MVELNDIWDFIFSFTTAFNTLRNECSFFWLSNKKNHHEAIKCYGTETELLLIFWCHYNLTQSKWMKEHTLYCIFYWNWNFGFLIKYMHSERENLKDSNLGSKCSKSLSYTPHYNVLSYWIIIIIQTHWFKAHLPRMHSNVNCNLLLNLSASKHL